MKVRAHHLLCIQGFRGLGYSPEFIQRMKQVAERIRSESDLIIEIGETADVICEACPHNSGICEKTPSAENRIKQRDQKVLSLLGIKAGDRLKNGFLHSRLTEKASGIDLGALCKTCEWFSLGYCRESLKTLSEKVAGSKGG